MNMQDVQIQLSAHIQSRYPILYLVTFEDALADAMICKVADGRKIYEWNLACGRVDFKTKQPLAGYHDLAEELENLLKDELDHHIIVIKDFHLAMHDAPKAVARMKALAMKIMQDENAKATIILISSQVFIPPELEKLITILEIPLPDGKEIKEIIDDFAKEEEVKVAPKVVDRLVLACCGLSRHEVKQLLRRGYQWDGAIDINDVDLILEEKRQIIRKGGILEMISVKEKLDDIGGLENLKQWLKQKSKILADLTEARKFGVESPKGLMIVGMPGCGKSLTAKAAASWFKLPLLRLDVGSLMGKYVGESEGNMRKALAQAAAVSPCVLWVDELEKAFAGIGHGGGSSEVSHRLFGYFLTWMQEKTEAVFVLATANDITALPPELMRKGRFDEIFYVDFPKPEEREIIFRIHLEKRDKSIANIDLNKLASKTEGFSGADIEAVVKETIELAFVENKKPIDTGMLLHTALAAYPLKEVMKDKIKDYAERFDKMRIKKASR